ncbi:four-carbon acid sugar kinase family protein [Nocardiopsis tropica]|uniref:four-carbon acid sugar kinase family protein n=1 Tax=Nocardiopsis tropica TaxID=109330 RepID=UPI00360AF968
MSTPVTPRVAVVADDLTGAGDTAVQFLRAGWSTELQLDAATPNAEVVAVSTDSRALPADRAAAAAAEAVRRLRGAGAARLYKKVDSTLRGPIRAEIDAVLDAWSPDAVAVVCPAFPANGRTVRDGVLLVDGVEVHRTAVGTDPVTPVSESRVAVLLGAEHVRLTGGDAAADAAQLRAAGPVVVADAGTDEDLARLAAAVTALGPDAVPVGSAGLAARLADSWAAEAEPAPALVVVTSLHQTARGQVEELAADDRTRIEQPAPRDLADDAAWRAWSAGVLDRFDPATAHTALVAPEDRDGALDPASVARRFGALAADLAARHELSGFVVTGGDGARALTAALDARAIALTGEVAPGIPLGTLSGGPRHGRAIVTKAGGFGSPTALLEAADAVRHTKGRNA